MNKELIEKLEAIRKDLVAFQAQAKVGDAKKLAELVTQKRTAFLSNYEELMPYMTLDQKMTAFEHSLGHIVSSADYYLKTGKGSPIAMVEKKVSPLLADLDDIAKRIADAPEPSQEGI